MLITYRANPTILSKFYEDINEVICVRKRGEFVTMENLGTKRLILHYLVPLIESMTDLHGLIKVCFKDPLEYLVNYEIIMPSVYSSVGRAGDCRG